MDVMGYSCEKENKVPWELSLHDCQWIFELANQRLPFYSLSYVTQSQKLVKYWSKIDQKLVKIGRKLVKSGLEMVYNGLKFVQKLV